MKLPSILYDLGGPHADKTAKLFWFFLAVDGLVFFLVLAFLFLAIYRRRTNRLETPEEPSEAQEHKLFVRVSLAVAATALILTMFVGVSYAVDHGLIELDRSSDLDIEIHAKQWWWEVVYRDPDSSKVFTTANEIHVPLGAKVRFILSSTDVIHSLWFPNFGGKRDIIPGRDQDLHLHMNQEGEWIGRCAEFCGMQHAMMTLRLFVDKPEVYQAWAANQRLPSVDPVTPEQKFGQKIFQTRQCMMCHALRTKEQTAQSSFAPDLTHLMSRSTIGAGAVENNKGYLGGWIIDPHGIKPGVHMPTILQSPRDFQALLAYLEILK